MKVEAACARARIELSAWMDDEPAEVELMHEHLRSCGSCRAYETQVRAARRSLRLQAAEAIPDLTERILERVAAQGPRARVRDAWRYYVRIATAAAAATALVLLGASLPGADRPMDRASAAEITRQIRSRARAVTMYRARFDILERGWHPDVHVRRFEAQVSFHAPEKFHLVVRDMSIYPGPRWPLNEVELKTSPRRWRLREPTSCPVAVLPDCAGASRTQHETRAIVRRQPFDGMASLPTDIILPLESVAAAEDLEVLGERRIAGETAYGIVLPYRSAVPLVSALQAGGSWRPFHPLDPVEVWLDAQTWFPLSFSVQAAQAPDRRQWAERLGLDDRPGIDLLRVTATSFDEPGGLGRPSLDSVEGAQLIDGGFSPRSFPEGPGEPGFVGGLHPYRAGVTEEGVAIMSYAAGMNWLKVSVRPSTVPGLADVTAAEEVSLSGGGVAYYRPASGSGERRVDIYGARRHVRVESNLEREVLMEIATSAGVQGLRAPARFVAARRIESRRLDPDTALAEHLYARAPTYLPAGYRPVAAFLTRSAARQRSLSIYYRQSEAEFDGFGIRIVQSPSIHRLAPTSEQAYVVRIGDALARWSTERGELEWIDHGVYRAVAVPSFDLGTALRIAGGLA